MKRASIVGASWKLGQHMGQHALDRGYEVVGAYREKGVGKLDPFKGRITVIPGFANDPKVIKKGVAGCDGVLTVLVPWGRTTTRRVPRRPRSITLRGDRRMPSDASSAL